MVQSQENESYQNEIPAAGFISVEGFSLSSSLSSDLVFSQPVMVKYTWYVSERFVTGYVEGKVEWNNNMHVNI